MIFKTINSSVDETRKTLALFNKDWNTYKRNWQNANGVFGKIGSVFTPANAITKSDIEAIKAYNSQIDSCVTSQTAFNRTMLNASPAAQNLVASYNGGKVSAQGMATAQNMAKTSTIGLTIAQTALNAAIGMGVGLLINLVVQGVNKLIHANEEAIESAKKLREEYEEFKSTNTSNVSTLKGLEEEFNELSKGVSQYGDNLSLTTEQYERYKEIIQQIVGMSPELAEGYSTENGYIADKNGLLERAIELQEIEYRNELRKITNLENLKTSMSGYIAEYKEALNGGIITSEGNIVGTTIDTDFKNSLWQLYNTNNRKDFDAQDMAKDIMESLGVEDVDKEMQKYFNEYGYWQESSFWNDYCDIIINNLNAVTDSLSYEEVGLDETTFDQNLEKLESYAESYADMKDSVEMANEAIQTDLGYIAEYADGYSDLTTEQQKFVADFLKGYDILDIASETSMGLKYDNDKMASVKNEIKKFVEELSQDETTKKALSDLYAIPTDEQSIGEFVNQFRNALEVIEKYCSENGIEIPIAISDSEKTVNELEAQYQRAVDYAKDKFDGYDPTDFFKEHSINTQEEIDKWQEIAQSANSAAEAEKEYLEGSTSNTSLLSFSEAFNADDFADTKEELLELAKSGEITSDVLESTEEYKALLDDTGLSAEQAKNRILGMLSATEKLSAASQGMDSLSTALDEWKEKGFVTASTLDSISDVFKENTEEYDLFAQIVGDPTSTEEEVKNAFNSIATEYIKTQDTLGGLTEQNMESYIANLEDMGIANAREVVESYMESKDEQTEIINGALKEYENYLDSKDKNDQEYLSNVNSNTQKLIKGLGSAYQDDYNNWTKLLDEKKKAYNAFVSAYNEAEQANNQSSGTDTLVKQYQDTHGSLLSGTYNSMSGMSELQAGALANKIVKQGSVMASASSEVKTAAQNYVSAVDNVATAYKEMQLDFSTTKLDFTSGDYIGSSSSSSSSSSKDTSETFDWIETKITRLTEALDKLKTQMDNTYASWTSRNTALTSAISKTKEAISLQSQAYTKYMQKANSVGLSSYYKNLVQNGSLNISTITDEDLADKISEYQEW